MNYDQMPGPSPEALQKRAHAVRKAAKASLRKTVQELDELQTSVDQATGELVSLLKTLRVRTERVQRDLQRLDDTE